MSRFRAAALVLGSAILAILFQNCSSGFQAAVVGASPISPSGTGPIVTATPASTPTATPTATPIQTTGSNALPISIGAGCNLDTYNGPCVSVKICAPGSASQCVTVDNILLDTGSTGLRVFQSVLNGITLPQITSASGGGALAECYAYGDGTYGFWGPLQTADVTIGGETASSMPIHVVEPSYASLPTGCLIGTFTTPASTGVNGIMGVNQLVADCGPACETSASIGLYYSCAGTACAGATVAQSAQTPNPISVLPSADNNGLVIQLPTIASTGVVSATGTAYFGIGTQADNTPTAGVTVLPSDSFGMFTTSFSGLTYTENSLVDSGTPAFAVQASTALPDCSGYLCPTTVAALSAVMTGLTGSGSASISFQIVNANNLATTYYAFNDIGFDNNATTSGTDPTKPLIWGLPFFFGRTIYFGFDGKTSSLASGPYVAF